MIHLHWIKLNSHLAFNILLHVTILYTILGGLFMYFIANVASTTINGEINHIIKNIIKDSKKTIEKNETLIKNNLLNELNNLKDNDSDVDTLKKNIANNSIFNLIKDNETVKLLGDKINNNTLTSLLNSVNKLKSLQGKNNYDYWLKLLEKDDPVREKNNNQVFFYIKFINVLLIVFLLFFAYFIYTNNEMKINDFNLILLENILTFIGVGIIEYLFFTNVALKYIPAPPSLLYESFMTSFKNNLKQYI